MLQISRLAVGYGQRLVLRDLELSVGRGEIFGLLGPNGAGKTSLIRTICGRIQPKGGTIRVLGGEPARMLRRIGLVPQEIALYPHLSVRENLEVFGRLAGLKRATIAEAVRDAARATGIAQRLGERIETLSGGWKRRVNIAAAILHEPDLLILDEPTVGIDVQAREGLHAVIRDLSRDGMSVLLTTHHLDEAESLCSRVGFLRGGKLDPVGTPTELLERFFGSEREIVVELRRTPTPAGEGMLRARGFTHAGGLTWSMRGSAGDAALGDLSQRLHDEKFDLREMRVREPGLDSLYHHLARDGSGQNGRVE